MVKVFPTHTRTHTLYYNVLIQGRAVASWFVTLIRMHMHAGSSPDWGTVHTGPLASLLTLSFFVLSRQCLKMRVLGVEGRRNHVCPICTATTCKMASTH